MDLGSIFRFSVMPELGRTENMIFGLLEITEGSWNFIHIIWNPDLNNCTTENFIHGTIKTKKGNMDTKPLSTLEAPFKHLLGTSRNLQAPREHP